MFGKATLGPHLVTMSMWTPTVVELLLAVAVVAALIVALVHTVHADGLGHRTPPSSHHAWSEGTPRSGSL